MKNKDASEKSQSTTSHRWFIRIMGIVVLLSYLEFNLIQGFRIPGNDWDIWYEFSNFLILLLPLPLIAFVFVPMFQLGNNLANRRPLLIHIRENKLAGKVLDNCHSQFEISGEFSSKGELVSDIDKLASTVSKLFKGCMIDWRWYWPAPYVIFATEEELSPVQLDAAQTAISRAGAIDVKYVRDCRSEEDALQFVRDNPTSFNIA